MPIQNDNACEQYQINMGIPPTPVKNASGCPAATQFALFEVIAALKVITVYLCQAAWSATLISVDDGVAPV
jgi:hypothetical protein